MGWASLVAQWLRVCLPMQGTRVRSLVREDPTCRGATKLQLLSLRSGAHEPQLLSPCAATTEPVCLGPVLCNKRSHRNEEWRPLAAAGGSLCAAAKTQCSQKDKKKKKNMGGVRGIQGL